MPRQTQKMVRDILLSTLLCVLAACGGKTDEQGSEAKVVAPVVEQQQAVSSEVSAMSAEALQKAATNAVVEQRLYAPAGNNAMEYYLALRDKEGSGDAAVASALADLQPYALIAAEQAITRDDFPEAKRLYALLEKTDPNAPALPRLKSGIADAENMAAQREQNAQADEARRQALEKKRQEEQQHMQQQAAQQLAAQRAEERRLEELRAAEDQQRQQANAREAEERRQAEQRAAVQRQTAVAAAAAQQQTTPAPAPAPAPVKRNTELRAISAPQPRYPAEALRGGMSGSVQVEFTVGTSGAVTSARVVNANPPRVFNNEVLNTVRRWRFQPIDESVTTRRTFTFKPEQ